LESEEELILAVPAKGENQVFPLSSKADVAEAILSKSTELN
jgi:hypothetical protein